jgi:hypothetical protein
VLIPFNPPVIRIVDYRSVLIDHVQIGNIAGEYVEGMWEDRTGDNSMKWYAEPLVKILRWQANGMAFELTYLGNDFEKVDLIAIAENLK